MNRFQQFLRAAQRNRPSRKPQLWEDLPLTLRRRLAFEVGVRVQQGWLKRPRVVELSNVGFKDDLGPLKMEVMPGEQINQSLFLYGNFEISETRLLQALLRPGMTFVDVGANIGYYTLLGARAVGKTGCVHAFEPNANLRHKLENNVGRNDLTNVSVHSEALARETGYVRFFASTLETNQGISSILPGEGREDVGQIPAMSLDDFAKTLGDKVINVLKMDIEGAELQVIAGGSETLARQDAPLVIFEAAELEPIATKLREFGYLVRSLHYSLSRGLELPEVGALTDSPFADYEAPNYFAAKDVGAFRDVVSRANAGRSSRLRLLGEL